MGRKHEVYGTIMSLDSETSREESGDLFLAENPAVRLEKTASE